MLNSRSQNFPLGRRALAAGVALAAGATMLLSSPTPAAAQWSTTYEQYYLPGPYNWKFRHNYPAADRLFNAFDFGHAILYETLWTDFDNSVDQLERRWYDELTKEILLHPPRLPLEEGAIEIRYARLAPEAKAMFDWAHLLHRQIYDVWADERIPEAEKDAKVAELIRYYKTRPDLAFSSKPKSMALMQEQPYSLPFRQNYPKFNGLIWAYHWLQVGLYEPLITGRTVDERQAGVRATVARFWQMLQDPPRTMPYVMPMTPAVAPEFAKRYPEAAIIFDNLHSMHDVVSDVLANPSVPRDRKRAEIMLAARRYRDDTSFVMSEQGWRTMAQHMGVENMGGVAGNHLPALPEKTVTYGAVMTHDDRTGEMTGFKYGQATGGAHAGMQHGATPGAQPADSSRMPAMDHSKMPMPATTSRDSTARRADSVAAGHEGHQMSDSARKTAGDSAARHSEQMMEMHMRMMSDTVIRDRIMADTAMRRMMQEMVTAMPAEHRGHMEAMIREAATPARAEPARRAPSTRAPARSNRGTPTRPPARPVNPPAAKPADPHAGHQMPAPKAAPQAAPKAAQPKATPPKPAPAKKDSMPPMDHSKMPGMKKP